MSGDTPQIVLADPLPHPGAPGQTVTFTPPETSVVIMFPTGGRSSTLGALALQELFEYERRLAELHDRPYPIAGVFAEFSGVNINKARNTLFERWLGETDAEWAWWLDTDMVVQPTTLSRLLTAAHAYQAKILGGLCVMLHPINGPTPTVYQRTPTGEVANVDTWPTDGLPFQVLATGSGCLLVHRDAAEAIAERNPGKYPWFRETYVGGHSTGERPWQWDGGNWWPEDTGFCRLANEAGIPVYVDPGAEVGHDKGGRQWWPDDVTRKTAWPRPRTIVCIPFKDKAELTSALVGQLLEQGGWTDLVLCDNGSVDPVTKEWLAELAALWRKLPRSRIDPKRLHVYDCPNVGIHDMWNRAVDLALDGEQARNVQLIFLNNDVVLGPDFCREMVKGLRGHEPQPGQPTIPVVSARYDGREMSADMQLVDPSMPICAGRYDGTGGLAGFAFGVRREIFAGGFRFPTEMKWWWGDTALMSYIHAYGHRAGIVKAATVEHVDGGSQTGGDWSHLAEQLEADRRAFAEWVRRLPSPEFDLEALYERVCGLPSDIRAHLPRLRSLVEQLKAQDVIELGVRGGVSSVALLAGVSETGGHLWQVDVCRPPRQLLHEQVTFIEGDDTDRAVLQQLPDGADVVFVDTSHRYGHTCREIELYAPLVRNGGCMVFHDTAEEVFPEHEGTERDFPVRTAVDEWVTAEVAAGRIESSDRWVYFDDHGLTVVWPHGAPAHVEMPA